MKKLLCLLLCLTMGVVCFANGQQDSNGPVTLEMMYWDNVQKPVIDEAIKQFEAENPNIKIKTSVVPWAQYWDKLRTSVVAGTTPDVFWMNVPNFPKYASNNALLDLQEFIDRDGVETSVYPSALLEKYSQNGRIHVIPEQFDTIALAYNKGMFDKAGLDYPNETWTWTDMRKAAQKLTKETADGIQYGFVTSWDNQNGYYNFMVMNGGNIIHYDTMKSGFDDQGSIEGIQYLYDLIYKYECAPTGNIIAEYSNPNDIFYVGRCAMFTLGSWSVPQCVDALGDDFQIAPLPKSDSTGERKSIIHGLGWAGYANTKHKEATWKFLKFITSSEFNSSLASSGITIPAYEGMADDWVNAFPNVDLQVFIDAQTYSHPYPVSMKASEWMTVESEEIKNCFMGYKTPEEAMTTIADKMNDILDSE